MLSAVAARKQQKSVIENANAEVVEPISDVDPVPSSKPPSKRKFDQTNSNTASRKRKKQAVVSQEQRMYEEGTKERYSTIVIKSNGRGYSPSAPVAIAEDTGLINPNEDEHSLSSFVPKLGQNLFIEKVRQNDNSESISTSVYLTLSLGEKLSFSGSVSLTVVRGTISMFGCLISASPRSYVIFAPKGYPIATMEAQELGDINDPICEVPSILSTQANNKSCIVKLEDPRSGVEEILNLYGSIDTTFEWSQDLSVDWALQDFHPIQTGNRSSMVFQSPSSWKGALDGLSSYEDTPSILIKGPKNTGKSMFARIVTNHLLQKYRRVAYIDCDIGQTEFTPPGMVSLHVLTEPVFGPPFTHLRQPFRAHFVGSASVRSLHLHYQACVLQLLETYRLDVRYAFDLDDEGPAYDVQRLTEEIPLVINMFGWTKGTGAEITREIETAASLTHVYMLDPDDTLQTNGQQLQSEGISYTVLEAIKPLRSDSTAADKRALMLMSYFHRKPESLIPLNQASNEKSSIQWRTELPLCAMPPWEVKWAEAFDKIVLIGNGSEDVHRTEVLRALNGAIVALVEVETFSSDWSSTQADHEDDYLGGTSIPYIQGTGPPPPATSRCVGYALIRGVRASTGVLHLLTPVSPVDLKRVRVIVMGEIRLPIQGMLDHRPRARVLGQIAGVDYANVPFLHWNTGLPGTPGSKKLRVRRNLMRKSQMER